MLWKLYNRTTQELTDLSSDIRQFRDTSFAVWIAGLIRDPNERDDALAKIVEGLQMRGRLEEPTSK